MAQEIKDKLSGNTKYLVIVAALGTISTIYLGSKELSYKKEDRAVDRYIELYENTLNRVNLLQDRIEKLEKENSALKAIQSLSLVSNDFPYPTYVISSGSYDTPGRILTMNDACYNTYYKPLGYEKSQVIYNPYSYVWGEEQGDEFWSTDMLVIETGNVQDFIGFIPRVNGGKGSKVRIVKWPRMVGNDVVSIAVIVLPLP